MRAFGTDEAKRAVAEAVKAAESHTAAEIVVAMRAHSGRYRDVDYLLGAIVALLMLCFLLFSPLELGTDFWPLEVAAAFGIGALACHAFPPLRRVLVRDDRRAAHVREAARNAFFELGISRTSKRTGVLVFASHFEKRVELTADLGIDTKAANGFPVARTALELALEAGDPQAFSAAIVNLGKMLGERLPRSADDVNELPDAPDVA